MRPALVRTASSTRQILLVITVCSTSTSVGRSARKRIAVVDASGDDAFVGWSPILVQVYLDKVKPERRPRKLRRRIYVPTLTARVANVRERARIRPHSRRVGRSDLVAVALRAAATSRRAWCPERAHDDDARAPCAANE